MPLAVIFISFRVGLLLTVSGPCLCALFRGGAKATVVVVSRKSGGDRVLAAGGVLPDRSDAGDHIATTAPPGTTDTVVRNVSDELYFM